MASRTVLLDIKDLRGGRNGVDSPLQLEPDQCVEAINVDWYQGLIGRRRRGTENVSLTGAGTTAVAMTALIRHLPAAVEAANELWLIQFDHTAARLVNGVWAPLGVLPEVNPSPFPHFGVSFNGKLFLAYYSTVDRLHVWDGTTIRRVGVAAPQSGLLVSAAAGTGLTGYRRYRAAWIVQVGGVTVRRSETLGPNALQLTNQGGWVLTRPVLTNEGETHWELYGAGTDTADDSAPYYRIATLPVGTTTYTDTLAPANFPGYLPLMPLIGTYTPPPCVKYLLVDEARLLMAGSWPDPALGSRVWWTPVLHDASGVGNDERIAWTVENSPFIDFDPGDGGEITGLGGPLFDSPYVFKFDRIYKMVRTGLAGAPYRPVTVSRKCGALRQTTIVLGEDETGDECVYFLSRRGPYRLGKNGLQYLGRDIEDVWARVYLDQASAVATGAHGVYHPELHQVWWWVPTVFGVNTPSDLKLVFDVKQGRSTPTEGVRRGWSVHSGESCRVYSSVMYSAVPGTPNSLTLKPYVGYGLGPSLWRCDVAATTDVGTPYAALIRTRVELPGGSIATHGGVIEGHLVSFPPDGTPVSLMVTTIRDFGLERREAMALLSATTPPTIRLVTPIRDLGAVSVAALQIEISDPGTGAAPWTLDELVLRVRREEDR